MKKPEAHNTLNLLKSKIKYNRFSTEDDFDLNDP